MKEIINRINKLYDKLEILTKELDSMNKEKIHEALINNKDAVHTLSNNLETMAKNCGEHPEKDNADQKTIIMIDESDITKVH